MIGEEPELAREQAVDAPRMMRDGPSVAVPLSRSAVRDHFSVYPDSVRLDPHDITSDSEHNFA